MARDYDLLHTRNIGIMAHIDAGKTREKSLRIMRIPAVSAGRLCGNLAERI